MSYISLVRSLPNYFVFKFAIFSFLFPNWSIRKPSTCTFLYLDDGSNYLFSEISIVYRCMQMSLLLSNNIIHLKSSDLFFSHSSTMMAVGLLIQFLD